MSSGGSAVEVATARPSVTFDEIAADGVELVLRKAEPGSDGDIGAVDDYEGPIGPLQVGKGGMVEHRLVVELGEEVRLSEGRPREAGTS